MKSTTVDLHELRADLQNKLHACDILLGTTNGTANGTMASAAPAVKVSRLGRPPGPRRMSPSARAKLSAIAKKRWAEARRSGKHQL